MRARVLALGFVLSLAAPAMSPGAFAQSPTAAPPPSATPPMAPAGGLTKDEFVKRAQERAGRRAAEVFDQMDTNHDGVLTREEFRAWRAQHGRRRAAPENPATAQ